MPGMRAAPRLALLAALLASAGAAFEAADRQPVPRVTSPAELKVQVIRTYPHDPRAFTQGLLLSQGVLLESTGLVGQSSLRRVEVATGRVRQQVPVPPPYFAEGLALVGQRLYQLTWQHGQVLLYDARTFARVGELSYDGEGWGLCHDGRALVMSNGSDELVVRDPATFAVRRRLRVTVSGRPLDRLNELECVGGEVYANVWTTDTIVRIDLKTGQVTARIDASGLLSPLERTGVDVLNGIAHDPADGTFLITGKLWPKLFRVRFVPA